MNIHKVLLAGAALLLSVGAGSAAESTPDEFMLLFTVKGDTAPGVENPENPSPFSESNTFDEGQVYSFSDVERISKASAEVADGDVKEKPLFTNAVLSVYFYDAANDIARQYNLAECSSVDIKHGEDLTQQNVQCDGVSYHYTVSGSTVSVMMDSELAMSIDLGVDSFMLNGSEHTAIH